MALIDARLVPIIVTEEPYEYILRREDNRHWLVRKMFGSQLIVDYHLNRIKDEWFCDCVAGQNGKRCKHSKWVAAIADLEHLRR